MADQFDPNTYSYQTAADQIARQRAIAQQLLNAPQSQGQMVPGGPNGFYVKPAGTQVLSDIVAKAVGAYMTGRGMKDEKANDANSQAALEYQLGHMSDKVTDGSEPIPNSAPQPAPASAQPPTAPQAAEQQAPSPVSSVTPAPAPAPQPPPVAGTPGHGVNGHPIFPSCGH